jgi:hypothetical protein
MCGVPAEHLDLTEVHARSFFSLHEDGATVDSISPNDVLVACVLPCLPPVVRLTGSDGRYEVDPPAPGTTVISVYQRAPSGTSFSYSGAPPPGHGARRCADGGAGYTYRSLCAPPFRMRVPVDISYDELHARLQARLAPFIRARDAAATTAPAAALPAAPEAMAVVLYEQPAEGAPLPNQGEVEMQDAPVLAAPVDEQIVPEAVMATAVDSQPAAAEVRCASESARRRD